MAIKAVIIVFSHMHVNEIALYIDEAEGIELCAAADAPSKTETIAPKRLNVSIEKPIAVSLEEAKI